MSSRIVSLQLPVEDAVRVASLLIQQTDTFFDQQNMLHSDEHRKAVAAEQNIHSQIHQQVPPDELRQVRSRVSPAERGYLAF